MLSLWYRFDEKGKLGNQKGYMIHALGGSLFPFFRTLPYLFGIESLILMVVLNDIN
ncbi:hypothetical protein VC82_2525 [Flagellimonas lutaonensis]|uniref:Uncharacterized protein n=1 Tax=Flagellimonas lutaonensis TaxID=516051 RepID=A0A0D5YV45_9FLAO|nr:hypothetical protein VC82_2525 [Allomuricauda lutaonensis]